MTPEERRLVLSLVTAPKAPAELSPDEFLRRFGVSDGQTLGLRLLREAVARRDGEDAELALIVCSVFGVTMDHLEPLVRLVAADWHVKHEDAVTLLGRLRTPDAVDALYEATQWVPAYLDFDESRALADKAVRALAAIPGERAEQALLRLLDADDAVVRKQAEKQIARRREGMRTERGTSR
jgi:hypothetical protein